MFNKYNNNYAAGILKKGSAETTIKTQLYGNTGTDIRESNLWELVTLNNGSKCYITKKYQVVANTGVTTATDFKQIPMIRLSELYLIAAEAAPYAEGVEFLKTFRTARNIGTMATPANPAALQTEIIKEYRKEFYAEGQAFYNYKRLNAPKASYLFAPSAATVNYLIPIPKTEAI
ncbi:SusD family protein [compost metagenome]